jgi:hypothetical protein
MFLILNNWNLNLFCLKLYTASDYAIKILKKFGSKYFSKKKEKRVRNCYNGPRPYSSNARAERKSFTGRARNRSFLVRVQNASHPSSPKCPFLDAALRPARRRRYLICFWQTPPPSATAVRRSPHLKTTPPSALLQSLPQIERPLVPIRSRS